MCNLKEWRCRASVDEDVYTSHSILQTRVSTLPPYYTPDEDVYTSTQYYTPDNGFYTSQTFSKSWIQRSLGAANVPVCESPQGFVAGRESLESEGAVTHEQRIA